MLTQPELIVQNAHASNAGTEYSSKKAAVLAQLLHSLWQRCIRNAMMSYSVFAATNLGRGHANIAQTTIGCITTNRCYTNRANKDKRAKMIQTPFAQGPKANTT